MVQVNPCKFRLLVSESLLSQPDWTASLTQPSEPNHGTGHSNGGNAGQIIYLILNQVNDYHHCWPTGRGKSIISLIKPVPCFCFTFTCPVTLPTLPGISSVPPTPSTNTLTLRHKVPVMVDVFNTTPVQLMWSRICKICFLLSVIFNATICKGGN